MWALTSIVLKETQIVNGTVKQIWLKNGSCNLTPYETKKLQGKQLELFPNINMLATERVHFTTC